MMKRVKSGRPVDKHVGGQVRMRRLMLNISQTTLGEAVGVSFQQIQKYENGVNRIGASRLLHIAYILGVPAAFSSMELLDLKGTAQTTGGSMS
jgi:transcriptional regulator with XRE-family HTH domain